MERGRAVAVGLALVVVGLSVAGPQAGVGAAPDSETTRLTVHPADGAPAQVQVRIADTPGERFTGLSRTAALGPEEGMVFVYQDTAERAFVMRGMAFPLDIVFVDGNGTITTVHHAAADADREFSGQARWVIEVNRGWTTTRGVSVGDRVTGLPR
jgi:uncharacterized membrane protein (UPF0127 family)